MGGARVVTVNSQLCASGLPEEEKQYVWLADTLRRACQEVEHVVLVMHTPPYLVEPDEDDLLGGHHPRAAGVGRLLVLHPDPERHRTTLR